jgi:hypothetical protein
MNYRGKSPGGHLTSHKSYPGHLDGTTGRALVLDHHDPEESRESYNGGGIVFSVAKALAAATADEAFAVVGVPHANFVVSPSHRFDSSNTAGDDNTSLGNRYTVKINKLL